MNDHEDSIPPSIDLEPLVNPVSGPNNTTNVNLEDCEILSMAFQEHHAVHLLYLQTVIANIFDSRTVLACNTQLSDGLDLLEAANIAQEQSVKPARTLSTVK